MCKKRLRINRAIRKGKSKLFTLTVVLSMFGYTYVLPFFPSINFGEIILLISCGTLLLRAKEMYVETNLPLTLFFLYSVIISLACVVNLSSLFDVFTRMIRDAFYWIVLMVFAQNFLDFSLFKKYVVVFCFYLSAMIVLQVGVYHLTGYLIPGLIPSGMVDSVTNGQAVYDHILFWVGHAGYLKPNGFLSEAAHSAQCLFIGALVVLSNNEKPVKLKNLFLVLIFMGASVLTFSASAVIYCVFVGTILLIKILKSMDLKSLIIIALIMVAFVSIILNFGINAIFERIKNAISGGNNDGSAFTRIYKGFDYWTRLPMQYQFFGIGFGNYTAINNIYAFATTIDLESEFMSTLSYILVSTGIFGFALFLTLFIDLFKKCGPNGRFSIIALLLISSAASVYSSPFWLWLMIMILNNKRRER